MKFAVINGSPKGNYSITLQTVNYLAKLHPEHEFEILNAALGIKGLERDFSKAQALIASADAVIFSYPVYTFMAPSQLHSFISLMKKNGIDVKGKYVTQITTSKHFYDVTAHRYVADNCGDMGMRVIRGLSADMDDLTTEKGRKQTSDFFDFFLWNMENGLCEKPSVTPYDFTPVMPTVPAVTEKTGKEAVIVTDMEKDDTALSLMIERFCAVYNGDTRVINLNDAGIRGGCLGCLNCSVSGKCVYNDGFDEFLRNEIQSAAATVYAFTIKDHSMGVLFKTFDDRQFCNGHRTVTAGKPVAYLINGKLSQEENLRLIISARAEAGGNFLCGTPTTETDPDTEISAMAKKLEYVLVHNYTQPIEFWGVGGIKIFRDLIYQMRGLMKADHRFYKKHGMYDFPQKKKGTTLAMYLVGAMFGNEKIMKKGGKYMKQGMLMPYKKVIDELDKKEK